MEWKSTKSRVRKSAAQELLDEVTRRAIAIFAMLVFVTLFCKRPAWVGEVLRFVAAAVRWLEA